MKTLKNSTATVETLITPTKILKSCLAIAILLMASFSFAQEEVEFDVYSNSAEKASQYLMGDDVALRDCASAHCEQLTTITIGTNVRLLAKSETAQTINGVKSRWYKIKMGPQIGWIWGGLISQKTLVSHVNPEVKFVFGEAGLDYKGYKRFQMRAVKNGVEIDKIFIKSDSLHFSKVRLLDSDTVGNKDVISLGDSTNEDTAINATAKYILFKNDKFEQASSFLTATQAEYENANYAYACGFEAQN
ncbi:SH3 domain-containing protein [Subsaximicrobium wynnwilliamsii]|uniref:SH3 domain-containing protein n=1 Tax=Subsaximicrobium wynnwilliamsii TaxID=291179 RepID=A0A5C6ZFP0_9FLAO|nr:SH3 domain-containing protein [Subsaximicrobium wynnwilliamsii]TXD82708.1 SH3 domain-containing protein [Subsaximicrobium wynnwilliamsii]TXD88443.1 SH3 domain-containing protein [Subsaximicrobium wynnwilliamsii]TXE02370.1 SH3 domain-containing protein [Subsaximicrobium wynnwilliamsii]